MRDLVYPLIYQSFHIYKLLCHRVPLNSDNSNSTTSVECQMMNDQMMIHLDDNVHTGLAVSEPA